MYSEKKIFLIFKNRFINFFIVKNKKKIIKNKFTKKKIF